MHMDSSQFPTVFLSIKREANANTWFFEAVLLIVTWETVLSYEKLIRTPHILVQRSLNLEVISLHYSFQAAFWSPELQPAQYLAFSEIPGTASTSRIFIDFSGNGASL